MVLSWSALVLFGGWGRTEVDQIPILWDGVYGVCVAICLAIVVVYISPASKKALLLRTSATAAGSANERII